MARKKKTSEEEIEMELEPTEIEEIEEDTSEVSQDIDSEAETSEESEESKEIEPKAKPRKRAARRKRAAKAIESAAEAKSDVETNLGVGTAALSGVALSGAPLPAVAALPSDMPNSLPAPAAAENSEKAFEQIAALVKQWEQSNAALTSQLEKLNQKIPSPTMKAATSWAPLARIAVGSSAAAVVLAVLSLVFSHSVRQQVLQTTAMPAAVGVPASNSSAGYSVNSVPQVPSHPRTTQQELALESLAKKARQEQAELAFATSKKGVGHSTGHPTAIIKKRKK